MRVVLRQSVCQPPDRRRYSLVTDLHWPATPGTNVCVSGRPFLVANYRQHVERCTLTEIILKPKYIPGTEDNFEEFCADLEKIGFRREES